jgi:hypothetical protein
MEATKGVLWMEIMYPGLKGFAHCQGGPGT